VNSNNHLKSIILNRAFVVQYLPNAYFLTKSVIDYYRLLYIASNLKRNREEKIIKGKKKRTTVFKLLYIVYKQRQHN